MFYSSKLINYPIYKQIKDLIITLISAFLAAFLMFEITQIFCDFINILQIILASFGGVFIYLSINYFIKTSPLHQAIYIFKSRNQ